MKLDVNRRRKLDRFEPVRMTSTLQTLENPWNWMNSQCSNHSESQPLIRARKKARSVKCLPHKKADLRSDLQNSHKKLGVVSCTCHPKTGRREVELGGPWCTLVNQSSWLDVGFSERVCLKNQGCKETKERHETPASGLHVLERSHTCTHISMHPR